MKAAAIYARVSTNDQADNGTSLDTQADACRRYAEQHGYTVVKVFKESKSGGSLVRPELDQLREMARANAIDAVIFYALDRLSRDETDTLILAREWRSHNVALCCATVPLENTPAGKMLFTMLAAMAEYERASILERTQRGKRQFVRNGNVVRNRTAIFGYCYTDSGTNFQIYEPEALWVRRIFDWYVKDGLTLRAIAFKLTEYGVPTKEGGRWASTQVRNMLVNEAYTGQYWYGRTDGGKERPRSEWIGPVAVPSLVSQEIFQAAVARAEYNRVNSQRNCKTDYLLRSIITCGLCGRRYRGSRKIDKWGTHIYYFCTKQTQDIPDLGCAAPRLGGKHAEEKVWDWVIERLSNPDLLMELLQSDDSDRAQRERDEADLCSLLALQQDLGREENKIIELFTNDAISLDKFKERNQAITDRRAGVEQSLQEIEERATARQQAKADIQSAAELIRKIQRNLPKSGQILTFEEKRALLDAFHVKVTAKADGNIHVTGLISEELLNLVPVQEEVLCKRSA